MIYMTALMGGRRLCAIFLLLLACMWASAVTLFSTPRAYAQTPPPIFTIDTSVTSPLTGLWWNANESGWGATITQQSAAMFVTMFVYDLAGNAVWYTVSCSIVGASCVGDMSKVRGGSTPTATWNGGNIAVTKVGTMTLQFSSNDAAIMSYTLDGLSATKQITRQIFGPPSPLISTLNDTWYGSIIETRTACTVSAFNGIRATYGQYDISLGVGNRGAFSLFFQGVTGLQCNYNGSFTNTGARLAASGNLLCSDGKRGTWQSSNITTTVKSMTIELNAQLDTTESCKISAILGGLRP